MKAFLVGFIFFTAVLALAGIAMLLFPVFIIMALIFKVLLGLVFLLFSIWLLGKFIIFVWENMRG